MSIKLREAIKAVNKAAVLCGSVGTLALTMSTSAYAQEGAEAIEEVTVTAIRRAFQNALATKRDANAVIDSISSEDIGKFPDKNIAESLQRISGVTINRGFTGEGNEVSIRGVNPELTQVMLNGQYVASTGWFSQQSNKRSFNMDMLPSEMVQSVDVYKSPVASLDEGGVGGTVIVKTRRPLDLPSLSVFASAEMMQNSIDTEDTGMSTSVMASWKNEAENFGILAAISSAETIGRAHKAENYWEEGWSASGIAEFNQDRERDGYDITAQFRPAENLTFTGHYFRSELDANNTNQNFLVINSHWRDGIQTTFDSAGGRTAGNGLPTVGTIDGGVAWLAQDTNTRQAELDSEVFDLNVEFEGDGYRASATVGQTEATGGNGGNANGLWGVSAYSIDWSDPAAPGTPVGLPNGSTIDIDMDGTSSMMMNPNGYDLADASWQALSDASLAVTELTDEETYAQVDVDFDVEWGPINSFEAGVKLRSHEFSNSLTNYTFSGDMSGITIGDFADGNVSHSGEGLHNSPTTFTRIDGNAYSAWLRDGNLTARNDARYANGFDKQSWAEVEEDITAVYTQANFEGDQFRGNVGMRYVQTDVAGNRYDATMSFVESEKSDYSDFLPSMNLAIDVSDNMILRLSAARVMSRAGYSQMSPSYTNLSQTSQRASKGNIGLEPFRATQTDIGLEWYFAEEALASAAFFTKDIRSFITDVTYSEVITDDNGPVLYTVTTPSQGRGGKLQGLELQYQQNFGNFGLVANYTYVEGEGETEDGSKIDLPGTSKNAYNLTGYYENEQLSARVAYTYRDEFLAEGLGIGGSSKFADQAFLDASVTWHVTDNIDVSLEGVNLLNEVTRELHVGGLDTMRVSNDNGARYFLKATYRM